jgi:hypothetical protein
MGSEGIPAADLACVLEAWYHLNQLQPKPYVPEDTHVVRSGNDVASYTDRHSMQEDSALLHDNGNHDGPSSSSWSPFSQSTDSLILSGEFNSAVINLVRSVQLEHATCRDLGTWLQDDNDRHEGQGESYMLHVTDIQQISLDHETRLKAALDALESLPDCFLNSINATRSKSILFSPY